MAKRLTDTEIWEEDWFIDLPNDYKLFYLYIKDKCDHSGIWRPNKRKFSMVLNGKMIHFDEFLDAVNKPDENTGKEKTRIIVLENGKWFLTKFVSFQCGSSFQIKNGAHRGALELLIANGIHPEKVPNFDWRGMEKLDLEELRKLVHARGLYRASLQEGYSRGADIEREREKEQEQEQENTGGKGVVGEKPKFSLQYLYDTPYIAVDKTKRDMRGVTEDDFTRWREFVDFIVELSYQEVFRAIFVHPADFKKLVEESGFTKDLWEPVLKKLLSTGIKPEQNLYFRIPDFITYVKKNQSDGGTGSSSLNAGSTNYDQMEKW